MELFKSVEASPNDYNWETIYVNPKNDEYKLVYIEDKKDNKFNLMSTILKDKYGYLYNYYIGYLVDNKILEEHKKNTLKT